MPRGIKDVLIPKMLLTMYNHHNHDYHNIVRQRLNNVQAYLLKTLLRAQEILRDHLLPIHHSQQIIWKEVDVQLSKNDNSSR
jgi:hypothetical protein